MDAFLLLASLWTAGLLTYSIVAALVVAKAADRPRWVGILVGLGVPVIGPLGWGLVESVRLKRSGADRTVPRKFHLRASSVLYWLSGLLFALSVPFPFVSASAEVADFGGHIHATPVDTGVGALFLVAAAIAFGLAGMATSRGNSRRVAILAAGIGVFATLISLTNVIAVTYLATWIDVLSGLTGKQLQGEATTGPATWLTLLGGALGITAALLGTKSHPAGLTLGTGSGPVPALPSNPTAWGDWDTQTSAIEPWRADSGSGW